MNEPDMERGIYRVTHTLIVGDARYVAVSDLIFQGNRPLVVLEWAGPPAGQYPALTLPLDAALLQPDPQAAGWFLYSGELADPRSMQ